MAKLELAEARFARARDAFRYAAALQAANSVIRGKTMAITGTIEDREESVNCTRATASLSTTGATTNGLRASPRMACSRVRASAATPDPTG
jgi:hypothetical protein